MKKTIQYGVTTLFLSSLILGAQPAIAHNPPELITDKSVNTAPGEVLDLSSSGKVIVNNVDNDEVSIKDSARNSSCDYDFADVPRGSAFYTSITWMSCTGLTHGYADGTFGRSKSISRGEFAAFLYRYSGESHKSPTKVVFKDVKANSAHATAISWMKDKGYTNGYADGSFGTTKSISRGEISAFLSRFAGESSYSSPAKSPFKDMTAKSGFYKDITWLTSTGVINGYADGTFKPNRSVTRGETSKFFYAVETHLNGAPQAPAEQPKPLPQGMYSVWTTVPTSIYANNDYTGKLLSMSSHTELFVLKEDHAMTQVRKDGIIGWVNTNFLTKGEPGTKKKPFANPTTYVQKAANNMAPWCWNPHIETIKNYGGGYAGFTRAASTSNVDNMAVDEYIQLGDKWDANHPASKAIQYHECAHLLQYRAYKYDYKKLEAAMDRVYPDGRYAGTEHMADCMADLMGATRSTSGYIIGYGGTCTPTHYAAARKLLQGKTV